MGFEFRRQRGSHMIYRRGNVIVTIPNHRELDRGTLRGILVAAGITPEEFRELLNG
jgi:predicted RNA binding protein YcfA (HicA-like mRNA interferase family)